MRTIGLPRSASGNSCTIRTSSRRPRARSQTAASCMSNSGRQRRGSICIAPTPWINVSWCWSNQPAWSCWKPTMRRLRAARPQHDAEKARPRRSHLESILNVAQRLRLRCFHRLRPCWTDFLSTLQDCSLVASHARGRRGTDRVVIFDLESPDLNGVWMSFEE